MTKEELKKKLTEDPEARKHFIAATTEYYKSIGLDANHKDLADLATKLPPKTTAASASTVAIITVM